MRNMFKALFSAPQTKASRAAWLVAIESGGRARWTPRDYAALAREGYLANAIVHRAVSLVAESAASVAWLAYEGDTAREPHPLTALLAKPNPRQERAAFLEAVCAHLLLAGNAYIEAVTLDGAVRELHTLRPDRMRAVPGHAWWRTHCHHRQANVHSRSYPAFAVTWRFARANLDQSSEMA